jgi:hypothetical protein
MVTSQHTARLKIKAAMVFRFTPHDALGSRSGQVIDILLTALKPIKYLSIDG